VLLLFLVNWRRCTAVCRCFFLPPLGWRSRPSDDAGSRKYLLFLLRSEFNFGRYGEGR
jgi:hypothetical protein